MHPAEHGSYVTLPVRLSQWDFNYGPAIDGSTQMSDFQKDDRRQMNKRGIAFISVPFTNEQCRIQERKVKNRKSPYLEVISSLQ